MGHQNTSRLKNSQSQHKLFLPLKLKSLLMRGRQTNVYLNLKKLRCWMRSLEKAKMVLFIHPTVLPTQATQRRGDEGGLSTRTSWNSKKKSVKGDTVWCIGE